MRLRNCFGMIWSVSTSARRSAGTPPLTSFTAYINYHAPHAPAGAARCVEPLRFSLPFPDVDEAPLDGGRGRHLGGDEVRAPAAALAALEVAIGRGRAALAGLEDVRVHAQAHRAAGGAPVEARRPEDLVEALALGLRAHLLGARDDHGVHAARHPAALDHLGGGPQVADPGGRARA